MKPVLQFIESIRDDHRNLRTAVAALDQARTQPGTQRAREKEVSRIYARCVVLSSEFLAGFIVMIIMFSLLRPFGTDDVEAKFAMSLVWLVGSTLNFFLILISLKWLVYYIMFPLGLVAYFLSCVLAYTALASLTALLATKLFPEPVTLDLPAMAAVFALVISLIAGLSILAYFVMRHPIFVQSEGAQKLLSHLPIAKRGDILAISAEDHYIRVITSKGDSLVRMKFSEATRMLNLEKGFQTHRSHWVAAGAVAELEKREHGGCLITLVNGARLPVAKSRARELQNLLSSGRM